MNPIPDSAAIHILKRIAQTQLKPVGVEITPDAGFGSALADSFVFGREEHVSEGDLARAALALLEEDPQFREPIRLMASRAEDTWGAERYRGGAEIALVAAVLLALQTRVKFKANQAGKWSVKVDKKAAGDEAVGLVVRRLLGFLGK